MVEYQYTENGEPIDVYEAKLMMLSPTRHISELRRKSNHSFYAFVDFNSNEGEIKYCQHCLEKGDMHNKLGRKIRKKDEPMAPDDEQWLSCYVCGQTFPVYSTFTDSKIKDTIQTSHNPFDNESTILAIPPRKKLKRKNKYQDEDPDIQREIDKHGEDNVHIIQ
ncbi:MAG TPA: hypothetical protein VE548_15905 [Nitrososphaeraceae archaeon]|jgi:hypothetical protein|nr:hypothetical protein [Nitrososphaeraceae archaeon]